jgi:PAS domain S-box-containing protein
VEGLRWIEWQDSAIRDENGRIVEIQAIGRDITERKQAEQALRSSEERFSKAFRASPEALVISQLSNGLIIEVNDGWRALFGYESAEVLGKTSLELNMFAHPEDRMRAVRLLQERGSLRDFELDIRRKSGEIRHAIMSAEKIETNDTACLLTILHDITERKLAEQALRESEQRLKRAQEIAHLGSWELDLLKNQLTWSDEVYRIFGLQPQEFGATYEAFLEAVHPEDRAAVNAAYSESIEKGRDTYEIEHRVVRRSSSEIRIVHEKCEHFRDQNGQIVRSVGMVHDITERKRAQEELHRTLEELKHSNAELEQFAYVASHDLQEPLRMVSSYMQLLKRRYQGKLDKDADEFIAYAVDGATRMQNLINDLLAFSRVGTRGRPMGLSSCEKVLEEALINLQVAVEESQAIITHDSLPTVFCDQPQLVQLFQNLLANSIKFRGQQRPQIHISAKPEPNEWLFSVSDNGIGLDPKFGERIFEIFQRLHSRTAYPGTGIGLAICKRIVQRHGGRIWVESQSGQGATFYFTLPTKETR